MSGLQSVDQRMMAQALELAARGLGSVEPNPMVGAVIAREGVVLAAGWHDRFGGPHAEAQALAEAARAGIDVGDATMYVTLEPCCHTNKKTPPCVPAVIASGISRVVVAMADPDQNVRGRGIEQLRDAGLTVDVGVLESQARRLLAPYVKLRTLRRPWVIAKWAQTADGRVALEPGQDRWISSQVSRDDVHRVRAWCDGILVGAGTVLADDPLLTNRSGAGKQPARVVLDQRLRTPPQCKLLASLSVSPVIVVTTEAGLAANGQKAQALRSAGAQLLALPARPAGGADLAALLDELGRRQWTYLLVEGGPCVLREFLDQGLADELRVYVSPRTCGRQDMTLPRLDVEEVLSGGEWRDITRDSLGPDALLRALLESSR